MKTIILDFDGTIADTRQSILETVRRTLLALSLPPVDDRDVQNVIGLPLCETFIRAAHITDEIMVEKAMATYRDIFGDVSKHVVKLFPNVAETLHTLNEKGLILAIASSRGHESLETLMNMLGISSCISCILGEQDVVNKKPASDMVLRILDQTGTTAKDALVVGDTIYDIQMGQGAGCLTCGVTYGNQTSEQLHKQGADYIIDDFAQIIEIVNA